MPTGWYYLSSTVVGVQLYSGAAAAGAPAAARTAATVFYRALGSEREDISSVHKDINGS